MPIRTIDQITDPAHQQLAALRGKLVSRLAVLEAVLADPSRGESLSGLILDLSRIATEEAQAAANEACLAIRTETDQQMVELRESAKTALDAAQGALRTANQSLEKERAAAADLRRELSQAKADVHRELQHAQLELQKQSELLKAREDYETELRTARQQLEEELARVREQMGYEIDRQQAIATELARDHDATLADLRSRLEAERDANAELRWTIERSQTKAADERAAVDEARVELSAQREANTELRKAAEQAAQLRAELEALESRAASLTAERDALGTRAAELTAERDALSTELINTRKWIADLRDAEAEFGMVAPPPEASSQKPGLTANEPEEGWQAIRLASRVAFDQPIAIEINSAAAKLLDLSTSGCQLLSDAGLRPHQIVKVQLSSDPPLMCGGKVVWTRLEPAGPGRPPSYRAGVRFSKPDEAAIEAFAARHKD
jgi:predicted  nucleic acid-binding Zn-ribbon protein